MRILLLEDDEDLRSALESVLEIEDYEVFSAADGAQAIATAVDHPFDILVFDIKLPGPDGLEILAQFKKENPDLLSVVMTGYATEQDTLRALRLGVGDYLKKPFRSNILLEAVRRLEAEVQRRRRTEQRERSASKLLLWVLEFLVGGLEANHESRGMTFSQCGRAGFKFALGLGYARETAEAVQMAVLVHFLRRHSQEENRLDEVMSMLGENVRQLLSEMSSPSEESPDQTLATLALGCAGLNESPENLSKLEESTGVSLQSAMPGREEKKRRQLLSLGRTFVASGDLQAARNAFLKLTDEGRSREAGYAHVELARLAWAEGNRTDANKNLRTLLTLLPRLGPQVSAELELEAGLSAVGMGIQDGRQLLERSLAKLERMGLTELQSLARLALRATCEAQSPLTEQETASFRFLAQQGLQSALLSHSGWLLPRLLVLRTRVEDPDLDKLLGHLVQEATRSVGRTLTANLPQEQLELLLHLVKENGASAVLPSLQSLFSQTSSAKIRSQLEEIISEVTHHDSPTLRINSLGPFEVWIGDHRLSETVWRTSRSRFLLAQLAARAGRPVLAEVLMEQFWPGVRPDAGKKNLSQTVSDLRKVLSENGYEAADDLVVRKHEIISLNPDLPVWHDLDTFREELQKGRQANDLRRAHEHLRRAYALLRGDYLEDCAMDWVLPQRREMERLGLECCELLARSCQKLELFPELLEVASKVLERDPCDQTFHLLMMEAYSASGRPEAALRQFDRAAAALQAELGVEPSMDLLRAQQVAKLAL